MGIVLGHAAAQLSAAQSVLFDRGVLLGIEVADGRGGARVPDNVRAAALKSVEGKLAAHGGGSQLLGLGSRTAGKKRKSLRTTLGANRSAAAVGTAIAAEAAAALL